MIPKTRVLIYALLCFGVLTLNFMNYAVLADGVIDDLGITYTQSGLILSIAALSYALIQTPAGIANDRYGGGKVMAVALAVVVVCVLGFATARSYEVVIISRAIMGLGIGSIISSCIKLISANFPSEEIDRANGIFISGGGLGFIIVFLIIPPVMEIYSWRGGLYMTASLTLLVLVIMPFFLRDSRTGAGTHKISGNSKEAEVPTVTGAGSGQGIISRNYIACIVVNFTGLSILNGAQTWIVLFLQDKYLITLVVAGLSTVVIGVANFFGALFSGMISSKVGRKAVIMVTMISCVAAPLLFLPSGLLLVDIALIGAIGWFGIFYFAPTSAIVTTSVDENRVGLAFGIYHTIGCMGIFLAPLIFGYILDSTGNFNNGFVFLGLMALAGVLAALILRDV